LSLKWAKTARGRGRFRWRGSCTEGLGRGSKSRVSPRSLDPIDYGSTQLVGGPGLASRGRLSARGLDFQSYVSRIPLSSKRRGVGHPCILEGRCRPPTKNVSTKTWRIKHTAQTECMTSGSMQLPSARYTFSGQSSKYFEDGR
jgi:hypothetical protein